MASWTLVRHGADRMAKLRLWSGGGGAPVRAESGDELDECEANTPFSVDEEKRHAGENCLFAAAQAGGEPRDEVAKRVEGAASGGGLLRSLEAAQQERHSVIRVHASEGA